MTIIGTQNVILQLLADQDILSVGEIKLALLQKQPIKDEAVLIKIIEVATKELEANSIIKRLDDTLFILVRPLNSFPQTVDIDGSLAVAIAQTLNKAAGLVTGKQDEELCNSMQINSEDIKTLVFIADEINKEREQNGQFDEFILPPNQ